MRLPASAATRAKFGWDWWAWNLLLAATPPTILWYGLSRTRESMRGEVGQLKAAIAEQKHLAEAQKERETQAQAQTQAQTHVPVVLPETDRMTPEQRIARLEEKLAVLEGHMSPTLAQIQAQAQQAQARAGRGGGGKGAEDGSLMSGVRRRVLGQYEDSVLEAFAKLKVVAAAGVDAGAGAGADDKTAAPPLAAAEAAGSKTKEAVPPPPPPTPPSTKKD